MMIVYSLITKVRFGYATAMGCHSSFQNRKHFVYSSEIRVQQGDSAPSAKKIPIRTGLAVMMGWFTSFHQKIYGTFTNSLPLHSVLPPSTVFLLIIAVRFGVARGATVFVALIGKLKQSPPFDGIYRR